MTSLVVLLSSASISGVEPFRVLRVTNTAVQNTGRFTNLRVGSVERAGEEGGGHRGFGPFRPVVVGAGIAFHGPGVRLAPSRFPKPKSRLRPPTVLATPAAFVAAPIKVTLVDQNDDAYILANQRRTLSRLRGPLYIVESVVPILAAGGPGVRLAPSFRGIPKSELRPPTVVNAAAAPFVASPVKVDLARIRPQRTQYRLGQPVVVYVIPLNFGPGVRTTTSRPPHVIARLAPPTVVTPAAAPFVASPIRVDLTRIRPVPVRPRLPEVIYDARVYDGIAGSLTRPLDRVPRTISDLRPPTVVAVAQTFSGPKVELARIRPPLVRPRLEPPVVIDLRPQAYYLAITLAPSFRGEPKSKLSAPTVVTTAAVAVYYGPKVTLARIRPVRTLARLLAVPAAFRPVGFVAVTLAPSFRGKPKSRLSLTAIIDLRPQAYFIETKLVRIRPVRTIARLEPPTDLVDRQDLGAVAITLAPSFRGKPKSRLLPVPPAFRPVGVVAVTLAYSLRGTPKSELRPPVVIDLTPQVYYVATTLARIRPVPVRSVLREPTDLSDAQDLGFVAVTLVRIRPVPTRSIVRQPVVIDLRPQTYFVAVTLAPQKRGVPKSRLVPPTVTAAVVALAYPIAVTLAPSFRGKPESILRRPVDLVDRDDLGYVRVRLAYQSRRPGRVELRGPVVIDLRPQTYFVSVTLVRIRPVRTTVRLEPPTDLIDRQDLGRVRVTLAPQKRGTPKSRLEPPTLIDLSPQVYYLTVELAPSFRGVPKSRLEPPTDLVDAQDLGSVAVTLVRIRPVPTQHVLRRPTDLVDRDDLGFIRVHLAYQTRGKPKSILRKPTVIDLRPQTYYISLTLAPSRFPRPKSILRPDSKFAPVPKAERVLSVNLTYSVRGIPRSKLRPPAVVGAGRYFRGILVRLAPSRFPKPKSRLKQPTAVQGFRIPVVSVTLAYSLRGKAKPRLPLVTISGRAFAPITTTLAPQRRGQAKPRLRQVVYPARSYAPVLVHLAPSTRGKPLSGLGRPIVLRSNPYFLQGPMVQYAPAPRQGRATHSRLTPPAVVREFVAAPVRVTLVRIRPPHTIYALKFTATQVQVCYGDVVGFDFAPEVCGSDGGATVTGTTSAGQTVSGSDSGATVTGASAPGGSVTGGDTKREGC